jgi:hypothetical protein
LEPLLFSPFQRQFNIGVGHLALLISLNFGIQLLVDLAAVHFVDRIDYRAAASPRLCGAYKLEIVTRFTHGGNLLKEPRVIKADPE